MRFRLPALFVALIAGALLVPARSTLAVHEPTCATAIASGQFNLIIATGALTGTGSKVRGTSNNDVIIGTAGDDDIDGGSGNDVICGRGGNDELDGGSGADAVIGDVGDVSTDGLTVLLDPAVYGPAGSPGNDIVSGGSGADRVWGDNGNDTLSGGSGAETVLIGGAGIDSCDGGSGADSTPALNTCETVKSVP
jgi:Ca2+-binding RTX toxin-like protein